MPRTKEEGLAAQANAGEAIDKGQSLNPEGGLRLGQGEKLRWLAAIAADRSLPPQSTRMAVFIADALDKNGLARLSVHTLARLMRLCIDTTHCTSMALRAHGYLGSNIKVGTGGHFWMLLPEAEGSE